MAGIAGVSGTQTGALSGIQSLYQQMVGALGETGGGSSFASLLADGISTVEGLNVGAQTAAVSAATGGLEQVQDYVIAASKAQVATSLTTTLRNKGLEAFNEIMRMSL